MNLLQFFKTDFGSSLKTAVGEFQSALKYLNFFINFIKWFAYTSNQVKSYAYVIYVLEVVLNFKLQMVVLNYFNKYFSI